MTIKQKLSDEEDDNRIDSGTRSRSHLITGNLCLISIFFSLGGTLINSFVNYFAVTLNANPFHMSILTASRNLFSSLLSPHWGNLADKYGKKPLLVVGGIILAVCSFATVFASSPLELILIIILQCILGLMFVPAWNALIGDNTTNDERGLFMGFLNSIGLFISILGLLVIGFFMTLAMPADTPLKEAPSSIFFLTFLISGLSFFVVVIISLFLPKQSKRNTHQASIQIMDLIRKDRVFNRFIILNSSQQFSMSLLWPIIPFLTISIARTWFDVALVWAILSIPQVLLTPLSGLIGDKFSRKRTIIGFRSLHCLIPLLYIFSLLSNDLLLLFFLFGISGVAMSGEINITAYVLDKSTEELRASYIATLLFFAGIATFLGSLLSGILSFLLTAFFNYELQEVLIIMLILAFLLRTIGWLSQWWIIPLESKIDYNLVNLEDV